MQHFFLGIAHVVLQLRQHGDGSYGGHGLKHILLPVLAEDAVGHLRSEVAGNMLTLHRVGDHGEYSLAVGVDGFLQFLATSTSRSEHNLIGSLQVFLVLQAVGIAIFAVGLFGNGRFQLSGEAVELLAHLLHQHGLVVPFLHLLRIGRHLLFKVVVDDLILLRGVLRSAVEAFLHDGKAVEHLVGDVQCQHSHQHDIHQVDHLLAWRDRSFSDCHYLVGVVGWVGEVGWVGWVGMLTVMASIMRV